MYYSQNIFLEGGTPSAYVTLDFAKISKKLGGAKAPLAPLWRTPWFKYNKLQRRYLEAAAEEVEDRVDLASELGADGRK